MKFSRFWTLSKTTLLSLAMAVMLFHFFVYVVYAIELMRFPFDYDQGEGFELVDAIYMSEGKLPYQDNDVYPFYGGNYPPVFRMALVPFVWVFGADYWYGRLLSFAGTLITASTIGYAIYRVEKRREIALLMGLAFLASNYIYHIGPLLRQHYFMVMFETLAVVLLANVFELPQTDQRRRLFWGLGILLVAGYTKQLAATTCIAVFVWLFIRNPRRAIVYGLGFGVIAGLIFLLLNVLTDGQWWMNVVGANVNKYIFSQFIGLFRQYTRLHWALMVMAAGMILYEIYFTRLSLYSVWFGTSFLTTIGSGSWGAGDSYFASHLAVTCILAGIFIARSLNQTWVFPSNYITQRTQVIQPLLKQPLLGHVLGMASLGLMIVYGLTVVKIPTSGAIFEPISEFLGVTPQPGHRYPLYDAANWTWGYATIGHFPIPADYDNGWLIVERMQATDLPVMSEEAGFSLRAGKEVITNPTQLRNLYDNGLLDTTDLVTMIENQEFGLILFRARFYPEPVLAAVDDAYYPKEVIPMNGFNYELWYPEATWETRRIIRNYLEGDPSEPLTLPLPADIADHNQWLLDMMARWAWLPNLAGADAGVDCHDRTFTRRGLSTELVICGDEIIVQPPQPVQ